MAKHRVRVTLVATTEVEIEVEAAEDESPTDLTPDEERLAKAAATIFADWEVDRHSARLVADTPATK